MTYTLELSENDSFANRIAVWSVNETPNQTSLVTPQDLGYTRSYFWHIRAVSPVATGPWSPAMRFDTLDPPVAAPPATPIPGPNPGGPIPSPGGSCANQRGYTSSARGATWLVMSSAELLQMLADTARI